LGFYKVLLNIVPGPGDLLVRFSMCRTWGSTVALRNGAEVSSRAAGVAASPMAVTVGSDLQVAAQGVRSVQPRPPVVAEERWAGCQPVDW
jgi:hypothetical protein